MQPLPVPRSRTLRRVAGRPCSHAAAAATRTSVSGLRDEDPAIDAEVAAEELAESDEVGDRLVRRPRSYERREALPRLASHRLVRTDEQVEPRGAEREREQDLGVEARRLDAARHGGAVRPRRAASGARGAPAAPES